MRGRDGGRRNVRVAEERFAAAHIRNPAIRKNCSTRRRSPYGRRRQLQLPTGTGGSNPASSTGESVANLISLPDLRRSRASRSPVPLEQRSAGPIRWHTA
jgi:hypothetical protein